MKHFLTIDVECYSGDYEQEVYGRGAGLSPITADRIRKGGSGDFKGLGTDGWGLPLILRSLKETRAKATFFVEALGATRWGLEPTKRICGDIQDAGHEIQLHLHPVAAGIKGFTDKADVLHFHPMETQLMLMEKGMEILSGCGATELCALRAGDFAADANTLEAMRRCGLSVSSNRDLDTKCSTRSLLNDYFPVKNDISERNGIVDVPLSCARSPFPFLDGVYRHLEISAVSSKEMSWTLKRMESEGYAAACVLTHPGELFCRKSGRPILKNIHRLELYCGEFSAKLFPLSSAAGAGPQHEQKSIPELPLRLTAGRILEQGAKRLLYG